MENIQQAQNEFNAVLKAQLEKASSDPAKPRCALTISFYHDTYIDFVAKAFEPITGALHRVNNTLIKICDGRESAMILCRELNAIVYGFNDATLKRPFYPEWLADYFAVQSLGINVIGAKHYVRSIEDEVQRQNEKNKGEEDPKQYSSRRAFAKDNVLGYSLEALKRDVTSFLLGSLIIPKGKETDVMACIEAMFSDMMSTAKGKLALENNANQRLVMAVSDKSSKIMEGSGLETREQIENYRRGEAKKESAERFREKNKLGFETVKTGLSVRLNQLLEMVELSETAAPFAGLDVMYSSPVELSEFNKASLEGIAMSSYYPVNYAAADILAALILEYFRIYTSAKHKAALMELSRNLSEGNLYNDAIENIYRGLVIQEGNVKCVAK